MALIRERLLSTSAAFLRAMNSWDLASILAIRSDDCIQYTLPQSVGTAPMTNNGFAAFFKGIQGNFGSFQASLVQNEEPIIDERARKVVLHVKSYATSEKGPYENEYIFILQMTEDAEHVAQIIEFLDSAYLVEFNARQETI